MLGIKKADIILCIFLVAAGILFTVLIGLSGSEGSEAVITVDGQIYGTYPLDEDREIIISQNGHTNKVTIKDSTVSMIFSDCANKVCVNHKPISDTGESIVCLPNKVMITIEGTDKGGYDAVSG